MTKVIVALALLVALVYSFVAYSNELITQYNALSGSEKVFTKVYCSTDAFDKDVQDKFDCFILYNR